MLPRKILIKEVVLSSSVGEAWGQHYQSLGMQETTLGTLLDFYTHLHKSLVHTNLLNNHQFYKIDLSEFQITSLILSPSFYCWFLIAKESMIIVFIFPLSTKNDWLFLKIFFIAAQIFTDIFIIFNLQSFSYVPRKNIFCCWNK